MRANPPKVVRSVPTAWLLSSLLVLVPAMAAAPAPLVLRCELDGTVDPGSAAYLDSCVKEAETRGAAALLLRLDTPGGSLDSTRQIVRTFLGARVPIVVWVGPSGARAGSAGVFLTLAAHVAAMAPATNIGAAHPVGPGGENPEASGGEQMARKIENDTVAFVEAIARQRRRNAEWAISAVKESASVTSDRALELGVIDLIAPSEEELIRQLSGRRVALPYGEHTLELAGAQLEAFRPTLRQSVVHWLANPSVAYILFLAGALGLAMELSNPGMVAPGLLGLAALVLAMVAMSALPIQAGAIVLLVVGLGLIVAELFVGHGLLALGGLVLIGLGGLLLVDRFDPSWFVDPSFHLPARVIFPSLVTLGGVAAFLAIRAAQARRAPMRVGDVGMMGEVGRALTDVTPEGGDVLVHGELWQAWSKKPIPKGHKIVVRGLEDLRVLVEEAS